MPTRCAAASAAGSASAAGGGGAAAAGPHSPARPHRDLAAPAQPTPRASPRLAEKVQRSTAAGGTEAPGEAHPPPHSPLTHHAATPTPTSAAGSGSASRTNSTASSPALLALQVHTPLSKRGSSHGSGAQRTQPPFLSPSPISLPPPLSGGARRKLLTTAGTPTASAACHGLPPSSPRVISSTCRTLSLSPMPVASAAELPRHDGPLVRSASCPMQSYHQLKLPSHVSDGVSFVTPRVAAMLLQAHESKNAGGATYTVPNLTATEQAQVREWAASYDRVHVLDARFPYEFEGGHIRGARHVVSHADAEDLLMSAVSASSNSVSPALDGVPSDADLPHTGSRVCVLVHCEFSKHRGPKCFKHLRKRDRDVIGIPNFPQLHFPEMYVIQGGYSTFFQQGLGDFCSPREYVSMMDKKFQKEYHVCWREMKRSTSSASASAAVSRKNSMSPNSFGGGGGSGSGSGGGDGGSGGKMLRRNSRTRSWTEMESQGAPLAPVNGMGSPAMLTRSLPINGGLPPGVRPTPLPGAALASMQRSPSPNPNPNPLPSHPRVSRGLNLSLDAAASAPGRATSAFSFASNLNPNPALANSPSASPFNSFGYGFGSGMQSSSMNVGGGGSSPSLTPTSAFFASGSNMCASPSPSYGWSTEGRSSTPSPFQGGESPRITASAAPSPVPWGSPSYSAAAPLYAGSAMNVGPPTPQHGSARATPVSLCAGDLSPRSAVDTTTRSRSGSLVAPPVFTKAVFASPTHASTRRTAQAEQSPSSALHSMHLRSSPSVSSASASFATTRGGSSIYSPSPSTVDGSALYPHALRRGSASPTPSPAPDSPMGSLPPSPMSPPSQKSAKRTRYTKSHDEHSLVQSHAIAALLVPESAADSAAASHQPPMTD